MSFALILHALFDSVSFQSFRSRTLVRSLFSQLKLCIIDDREDSSPGWPFLYCSDRRNANRPQGRCFLCIYRNVTTINAKSRSIDAISVSIIHYSWNSYPLLFALKARRSFSFEMESLDSEDLPSFAKIFFISRQFIYNLCGIYRCVYTF